MYQDDQHILDDYERKEQLFSRALNDKENIELIKEMFEDVVTEKQFEELVQIQINKELEV